ncbi:MAG: hypothetical protein AB7G37_11110, partial [Solirubrobacteraceae bacterium]
MSSVDLLGLRFAFSQSELMDSRDFVRAAEQRGLRLTPELLEFFHRQRVLEPLFGVRRDGRAIYHAARRGDLTAHALAGDSWTSAEQLRAAAAGGRVLDPSSQRFVAYARLRRSSTHVSYSTMAFVYSSYQLLAVPLLRVAIERLAPERRRAGLGFPADPRTVRALRVQARRVREHVLALCALDSAYRPAATTLLRGLARPEGQAQTDYDAWRDRQDPQATLGRLGVDPDWLALQAEALLRFAENSDPLGSWIEVVRQGDPRKWMDLRGDALVTMDHRVAAEIFLAAHEALVRSGRAAAIDELAPQGWVRRPWSNRLRGRGGLDRALMRYGLSPQPAVLMVVEGDTERRLFP